MELGVAERDAQRLVHDPADQRLDARYRGRDLRIGQAAGVELDRGLADLGAHSCSVDRRIAI